MCSAVIQWKKDIWIMSLFEKTDDFKVLIVKLNFSSNKSYGF